MSTSSDKLMSHSPQQNESKGYVSWLFVMLYVKKKAIYRFLNEKILIIGLEKSFQSNQPQRTKLKRQTNTSIYLKKT